MASYSASMITTSCLTDKPTRAGGSFANINIDGRLSLQAAIEVARDTFKREAQFKHENYRGFAIEKTSRFLDYRNPVMVDTDCTANQVGYLLS